MANELTGDYDVVTEFTVAAVNRILCGMHCGNRFPHSMSVHVDDTPHSKKTSRAIVDTFGDALTDHVAVRQQARYAATSQPRFRVVPPGNIDPVVNELRLQSPLAVFSGLQGVAELQLGSPTIQLPQEEYGTASIRTPVLMRYIPDTAELESPLPEFLRGEIVTSLQVQSERSEAGTYIHVGLLGAGGNIHFEPKSPPLTDSQLQSMNRALFNAIKTSFQPSNTALPDNVAAMDFKAIPHAQVAASLMSLQDGTRPDPDSLEAVFIKDGDHFAMAFNGELMTRPFASAVNEAINPVRHRTIDNRFEFDYGLGTYTSHIIAEITVLDAQVELQDIFLLFSSGRGQIVLTIPIQLRFRSKGKRPLVPLPPNLDFHIKQAFTLTLNGAHVGLQTLGNPDINIPPNYYVINLPGIHRDIGQEIKDQATNMFDRAWSNREGQIRQQVHDALSVQTLQRFLRDLMNAPPIHSKPKTPPQKLLVDVDPELTYTSFEIKPAGIVLHGSLALPPWPNPHVEFEVDRWKTAAGTLEYNALNSWIPGGTIKDFVWSYHGRAERPDEAKFISTKAQPVTASPIPVCLTVDGSRLTASGPVALESRTFTDCKGMTIPKMAMTFDFSKKELKLNLPNVVVPLPSSIPVPTFEVAAHTSPWADPSLENTSNFLIHYPDQKSFGHLGTLIEAVRQSERADTATAVLCVLAHEQLATVGPVEGIMFSDDAQGWERSFGVTDRPATVLFSPAGQVSWRRQGAISTDNLAAALKQHLKPGGLFRPRIMKSALRIGQLAPNFIFDSSHGRQLTLRKLSGRPVVLLFWQGSSRSSLQTFRLLNNVHQETEVNRPVILAIRDGEDGEVPDELAHEKLGAVIVPDPQREISVPYGISLWPTTIFLNKGGTIKHIQLGSISAERLRPAGDTMLSGSASPREER